MSLLVEVKKLIAEQCANHAGKKNYCWWMETSNGGTCIYFNPESGTMPRCKYFEVIVLPQDPDLEDSYKEIIEGRNGNGRSVDQRGGSLESLELKRLGLG